MTFSIHPTAIIHANAELGADVEIGAYCVVGASVRLGARTILLSHTVLEGSVTMGDENLVHPFAVIGGAPQSKRHDGRPAPVVIGDRNVFREHVTVHGGANGGATRVGSDNLFMATCHVAHDVTVGSHVVVANAVQLAGHSTIEDWVTFGGLAGVAQFVRVGESAFVAGGAMCERTVPPFVIVQGDRARVRALNRVGLRRRGFAEASIDELDRVFRAVFASKVPRQETLRGLASSDSHAQRLIDALRGTGTGR